MAKRIYVVGGKRLVRAVTNVSARNHVAKDTITSELASQDTLVELTASGVKVETAGDEPPAGQTDAFASQDGPPSSALQALAGDPPPNMVCAREPFLIDSLRSPHVTEVA
jgi:hypothetical protein